MNKSYIDQMGHSVILPEHPNRIVSLVPSQTELLFDLGLDIEIVGLTRFCIHPDDKVTGKARIGGTKDFDVDKIRALNPDLIIGNKEENYEDGIMELKKHYPLWMSDIYSLDDAYAMMKSIGEITNRQNEAQLLVNEIKSSFTELPIANSQLSIASCAYFIWRKPYMVAASGTFIDHMLGVLGLSNAFAGMSRYPRLTSDQIAAAKPDYIFLSSEPYSFNEKHIEEFQKLCPMSRVSIVDGELFSWYGSRLKHTAKYFQELRRHLGIHL
jgi:ABC-type Fe3+-hydroxamate transport system substrate-binding protein